MRVTTDQGTFATERDYVRVVAGRMAAQDARAATFVQGLGAVDDDTMKQKLIDAAIKGAVPASWLDSMVKKIIDTEAAIDTWWNTLEKLRKLPADKRPATFAESEAKYGPAWKAHQKAKFYALLLKQFRERLGYFTARPTDTSKRKVRPPALMAAIDPPPESTEWSTWLRSPVSTGADKARFAVIEEEAKALLRRGWVIDDRPANVKAKGADALRGLGALGFEPLSTTTAVTVVATVAIIGLVAYKVMADQAANEARRISAEAERLRDIATANVAEKEAKGEVPKGTTDKLLKAREKAKEQETKQEEERRKGDPLSQIQNIVLYAAGGLAVVAVAPAIISALAARRAQ